MWSPTFSLFIRFLIFLIRLWLRALWVMVTLETLQLMTSPWHQAVSLQSVSRFVNSIQQSADINLKAGSTVHLIWTCLIKLLFMLSKFFQMIFVCWIFFLLTALYVFLTCLTLLMAYFFDRIDQIPGVPTPAPTIPGACGSSQLTCGNGNCYSPSQKCNFQDDCGDNSDETNCGRLTLQK